MFGYMDESGTPGATTAKNDWFTVSLLLFNDIVQAREAEERAKSLKTTLSLPDDYEFHRTHNSKAVQVEVEKLLSKTSCKFVSVSIEKTALKSTASYKSAALALMQILSELKLEKLNIKMDTNPELKKELLAAKKLYKLSGIKIKEARSSGNYNLQLVDYIVNISARSAKGIKYDKKRLALLKRQQLRVVLLK